MHSVSVHRQFYKFEGENKHLKWSREERLPCAIYGTNVTTTRSSLVLIQMLRTCRIYYLRFDPSPQQDTRPTYSSVCSYCGGHGKSPFSTEGPCRHKTKKGCLRIRPWARLKRLSQWCGACGSEQSTLGRAQMKHEEVKRKVVICH